MENSGRFTSEKLKGKSYEERYGVEKATEVKANRQKAFQSPGYKNSRKVIGKMVGDKRRGKSLEELYGVEKALEIKEKIKEARLKQECPRTGKKNTPESKKRMSLARLEFLEKNPEYLVEHGNKVRERWKNMPETKKSEIRKKCASRFLTYRRFRSHSIVVEITHWDTKERILCESSYEYYCFLDFNNR